MTTARFFKYAGFGILGIGFVFLAVWVVMLLWNALIPALFNGPILAFWQTAGLMILAKILLSGFGSGRSKRYPKSHSHWRSERYKDCYEKKKEKEDTEAEIVSE